MKKSSNLNLKDALIAMGTLFLIVCLLLVFLQETGKMIVIGFEEIANISSKTDAVIIVAMITGGISIITVIISSIVSKIIEYKNQTNRYLYEKRERPYSEFISMVYKLQENNKKNGSYAATEMKKDISKFSESLTLWGSSNVIKKWLKFRNSALDANNAVDNLFILEEIVYEIRKDMGQKKKGLKKGDLLAFFVNDIYNYVPDTKKTKK